MFFGESPSFLSIYFRDNLELGIGLQLHEIQDKHFYNENLNEVDRSLLTFTFNSWVAGNRILLARRILKVDFLGDKCVFEVLLRGARGI